MRRAVSRAVAGYPLKRGQTRLRDLTRSVLVAQLPFGAWVRISGVVENEWKFLEGVVGDSPSFAALHDCLFPGAVFVDVGANVGCYSLFACVHGCKVTAFEPTPDVFQRLRENLALNGFSATLHNSAVMDKPQLVPFFNSPDDPEANNVFGNGSRGLHVPAVKLDDYVEHADVLKIDAEGAEPYVLDGAHSLISRSHPKILIEVNPHALRSAGFTPQDVYRRLEIYGYKTSVVDSANFDGETVANVLAC